MAAAAAAAPASASAYSPRHQTPVSRVGYQAGYRDAFASPSHFSSAYDADAAESPPTPAQTAVARAEVALLEAKMEALRERLDAAAAAAARMEARARAAASSPVSGEGAGERGEAGDEKDKNEGGAAEETEAPGVVRASVPAKTRSRTAEKGKAPAAAVPAFSSEAFSSEDSGEVSGEAPGEGSEGAFATSSE